ncbi:MAG TPA: DNA repair and recombination protein RadB [Methanolinea sp.]|jgi:DNA repair protein RadB|nr:MAG: DNA repair and recombination protein RadB [Methanoregulaceae archaeon PtaB.Bin009]OPY39608.1 MAG: DNA repair and recombination protein RadB [Methanoregulaceae archaeon PtaU1.Bin066]HII75670.1 DNA repair and recombination protein RadB [Methanolinea sp.]HNQ28809.1 DNA repair and recombination protein RadB [Methanolinea sp.]HNS82831.1 DNA repair and recombination protein RadB [Methanolinea sp.]
MNPPPLSTGSVDLDEILGGGLARGVITQVFGEPASGKSTICVMASVSALRSGDQVLFLDSEGFSAERFRQIAGEDAEKLAAGLYLYEPEDFTQQGVMVKSLDAMLRGGGTGLVVVDSATGLYRSQLERGRDAMQKLTGQVLMLLGYARRYRIPVLISNQVYTDTTRNVFVGLGGTALEHLSKTIIRLERRDHLRRATLAKHRSLPPGAWFDFEITQNGIRAWEPPHNPKKEGI